jgi:hypothetical protein
MQVASKDDVTAAYDATSNSFVATAQILSDKPAAYTIDATLLKDGFKTARISKSIEFEPELTQMKTTLQFDSSTAPAYGQPIQVSAFVRDAEGKPISSATVQVEESGPAGLVVISSLTTDQNGAATFAYTPTKVEGTNLSTLVVTAYKDGFKPSRDSKVFEVGSSGSLPAVPVLGTALGGLPSWMSYAIIGGVAAGGGGFYMLKRPRAPKEESLDEISMEAAEAEVDEEEET